MLHDARQACTEWAAGTDSYAWQFGASPSIFTPGSRMKVKDEGSLQMATVQQLSRKNQVG